MKFAYDSQNDVLKIFFTNAPIDSSRAALPGVVFDYDDRDGLVALELREASSKVHDPHVFEVSEVAVAPASQDEAPSAAS